MGCETNCLNEHRIQSVEKELSELRNRNSQEHKGFYNRIESLEKENAVLKKDIEYIKETMEEMNGNLKILIETPAKRYETIIACVITTVVGAVIGLLLSGVLPM